MMRGLRQRSVLRPVLWVMLLVAVVLKPALVFASQAHEVRHATHALSVEASFDAPRHATADAAPDAGDLDPWHSLMHAGHCCSHPWAAPASALLLIVANVAAAPPMALMRDHVNAGVQRALRPPIRA